MKTIKSSNVAYKCYGIYKPTNNAIGCIFDTYQETIEVLKSFGAAADNYEIVIVVPHDYIEGV